MEFFMEDPPSGHSSSGLSQSYQNDPTIQIRSDIPARATQHTISVIENISENATENRKGRKGHRKSRNGCFNCKRARIKCKENKPDCDYCAHRGLKCEWPELQICQQIIKTSNSPTTRNQMVRRSSSDYQSPEAQVAAFAQTLSPPVTHQDPVFNMQDFRLFNFFIQEAYPHHPLGNDKVWRHEIPCMASDYDFLLHSMLALSASELACTTDATPQMHSTALSYRVKAISSLNSAISQGVTCFQEGNAMLATCFALLFQSCLLEDGLMEYMMFIRGTISIGFTMGAKRMQFVFTRLFDQEQLEQVDPMMKSAPLVEPEVVAAANRSFERFAHFCTRKVEKDVFKVLSGIARALITSSRDAYLNLRRMYELFSYTMPQREFEQYCDPSSVPCQLLQAHFVALQLIMAPVTRAEFDQKEATTGKKSTNYGQTVAWLVGIHRRVPHELEVYFAWTMWVQREVLNGNLYNGNVRDENLRSLKEVMGDWNEDWSYVMNPQ